MRAVRASLLILLCSARLAAAERLIVLIDDRAAHTQIAPLVTSALSRKGYEIVSGPEIDAAAGEHPESLTPSGAAALADRFQAKGVLAVTVHFFLEAQPRARGPAAGAALGLTAKEWPADGAAWRNSFSMIGDAGAKKPVAKAAVARLLWSFPRAPGAKLAGASQDFDDLDEATSARAKAALPPSYDAPIERLRAERTGPRFLLRARKESR
jgi:hypothetical protein